MFHSSLLGTFLLWCSLCTSSVAGTRRTPRPFAFGDRLKVECYSEASLAWKGNPPCIETGQPISILFGVDNFLQCGIPLESFEAVKVRLLPTATQQLLSCRIASSKKDGTWIPLPLPLAGTAASPSAKELHIQTKYNVVIHASQRTGSKAGHVLGAAVYPVYNKGTNQFARKGSTLSLQGKIRWFRRESFIGFSSRSRDAAVVYSGISISHLFGFTSFAVVLVVLVAVFCFARESQKIRKKFFKGR